MNIDLGGLKRILCIIYAQVNAKYLTASFSLVHKSLARESQAWNDTNDLGQSAFHLMIGEGVAEGVCGKFTDVLSLLPCRIV